MYSRNGLENVKSIQPQLLRKLKSAQHVHVVKDYSGTPLRRTLWDHHILTIIARCPL